VKFLTSNRKSREFLPSWRKGVKAISEEIEKKLFIKAASNAGDPKLPDVNELIEDYWRLKYRRVLNTWKSDRLPPIVTHNLADDGNDAVLNFLRAANLINNREDRVKIIYHPDFITESNPLFGLDYSQFVRGCNMGIFPSYYEPWGYTPLECMASGIPTITSNLAGFGDFVYSETEGSEEDGVQIVDRVFKGFNESSQQLADMIFEFIHHSTHDRITQRNKAESFSTLFDWEELIRFYEEAYSIAISK